MRLIYWQGNFALLPLRTRTRGPAQQLPALPSDITELSIDASHESYDPLDEILALFRANTFFRNFEIKGPADRVMIYGILFVSEALSKIKPNTSRRDAEKVRHCQFHQHRQCQQDHERWMRLIRRAVMLVNLY